MKVESHQRKHIRAEKKVLQDEAEKEMYETLNELESKNEELKSSQKI
jgi:hypothetical protein